MKKYLILISILLMMISCKMADADGIPDGNTFLFENPQPINDSELSKIPIKYRGIYLNSDSIYLNINENSIIEENYNRFKFHKTAIDTLKSEFDIVDGKYIEKTTKEVFTPRIIGDSIELTFKNQDTIFAFSNYQKAKRVNGQMVISEKDSVFWKIKMLSLNKNVLNVRQIYSDNDLLRMDSITKIKSKMIDSTSFIISPRRSEFVKIINLKKFGFDREFKKIK